jgi:crotonobetainyl-CoA:carnitine CoA-transferase CaiB-like acyl-CoA transferase
MHAGVSYGDPTGGLHGAFAVLAALLYRARTGRGQFIDLSQQETSIAVLPEGVMDYTMNGTQPPRNGNRDPHMAPHGVFRCAGEQRWVAISIRDDAEWQRFAGVIGCPELAADLRYGTLAGRKAHEDQLDTAVTEWTLARSPEEVTRILQGARIPAFTSFSSKDIAEDPHLNDAEFFVRLDHPDVGVRQHIGMPWRMTESHCAVRHPAPCLGEHTDYVMGKLLNYPAEEIRTLKEEKVLN